MHEACRQHAGSDARSVQAAMQAAGSRQAAMHVAHNKQHAGSNASSTQGGNGAAVRHLQSSAARELTQCGRSAHEDATTWRITHTSPQLHNQPALIPCNLALTCARKSSAVLRAAASSASAPCRLCSSSCRLRMLDCAASCVCARSGAAAAEAAAAAAEAAVSTAGGIGKANVSRRGVWDMHCRSARHARFYLTAFGGPAAFVAACCIRAC